MQTVLLYLYISAYLCIIAVDIYLSLFSFLETQTSETLISRSVVKNGCLFYLDLLSVTCFVVCVELNLFSNHCFSFILCLWLGIFEYNLFYISSDCRNQILA